MSIIFPEDPAVVVVTTPFNPGISKVLIDDNYCITGCEFIVIGAPNPLCFGGVLNTFLFSLSLGIPRPD